MRNRILYVIFALEFLIALSLAAQRSENCFLDDFEPKSVVIPPYEMLQKPDAAATVNVTFDASDTLGQVSKYIFGNAVAVWIGNVGTDPILLDHLKVLSPTLIRFPGGSWSDIFFWNARNANDIPGVPDTLYNASTGQTERFSPQFGVGSWSMSVDNYYDMRWEVDTQGLITINYGYARYGLTADPVAQAAHLSADWVRYDDGRTLFWEIGNESGGPWEAGWQIYPALNQDGQPEIITGELYGKHFRVFADSMRKTADETGATIYIGAQILHYNGSNSWNVTDRQWNHGVFSQVGDAADFYVIHNYFGNSSNSATTLFNIAEANDGFYQE
jgi:hypothetical protein